MAGWKMDHLKDVFLGKRWVFQPNHATVWLPEGDISHRKNSHGHFFRTPFGFALRLGTGDGEFEGPSAVQSEPSEHLDFVTRNQIGRKLPGTADCGCPVLYLPETWKSPRSLPNPTNELEEGWINIPFFMPKC